MGLLGPSMTSSWYYPGHCIWGLQDDRHTEDRARQKTVLSEAPQSGNQEHPFKDTVQRPLIIQVLIGEVCREKTDVSG